jgi:hypothetical protein
MRQPHRHSRRESRSIFHHFFITLVANLLNFSSLWLPTCAALSDSVVKESEGAAKVGQPIVTGSNR